MFEVKTSGTWSKTEAWLDRLLNGDIYAALDRYGQLGVSALAANTPSDTGETARGWAYTVSNNGKHYVIEWYNTHVIDGVPIAVILQYGHGTGTGGYVTGTDYINPAIEPVFDQILDDLIKEVKR